MDLEGTQGARRGEVCARSITYRYRYCPRCRREWPAERVSCQECRHWLGDRALTRREWKIVPVGAGVLATARYEAVGASAVTIRIVCDALPEHSMTALVGIIDLFLEANSPGICPVPEYGWLSWTTGDLRGALRAALSIDLRLRESLKAVRRLVQTGKIRWGVWVNQYVLRSRTAVRRPLRRGPRKQSSTLSQTICF